MNPQRPRRLPDFAGVALVDILANGLAMLIIVIVLSIAARTEHEERTTAQVEELETMMSRRFSTSLVLNSLAATPPARLHDYRESPLDQEQDPYLLPIIELHRNFVREFYTGAVWSREELLGEPNAMDAWLASFDEDRKKRLRTDVYDVAQFYLAMSILRDHEIKVLHWHFIPGGGLGLAQAGQCPPGVSAQDCGGSTAGADGEALAALPSVGADGGGDDHPSLQGFPGAAGNGSEAGPFPGGAALGGAALGGAGNLPGTGSFPNAQPGSEGISRGLSGAAGAGQGGVRFRLSSPESLRSEQALDLGMTPPSVVQILAVLLNFTGELQKTLDAGASPSAQLADFQHYIRAALTAPLVLEGAARDLFPTLMAEVQQPFYNALNQRSLRVVPLGPGSQADTALIVQTNRRLRNIAVQQSARGEAPQLPNAARPVLRLNAHPDVWRGLSVPLEKNAIVLMPPEQQRPEQLRWRALAYLSPALDDFIVGFAYAAVAPDGRLVVQAEDNRVRLNGRPLQGSYRAALFGARSWLVALYAGLVLGLLGLLLLVPRPSALRRA